MRTTRRSKVNWASVPTEAQGHSIWMTWSIIGKFATNLSVTYRFIRNSGAFRKTQIANSYVSNTHFTNLCLCSATLPKNTNQIISHFYDHFMITARQKFMQPSSIDRRQQHLRHRLFRHRLRRLRCPSPTNCLLVDRNGQPLY